VRDSRLALADFFTTRAVNALARLQESTVLADVRADAEA
jgi:hypothetical protein